MSQNGIILVGGPDSGKTNFLARLWEALRGGNGVLRAPKSPPDVKYVEEGLAHLLQGTFAPRSDKGFEEVGQSFSVPVERSAHPENGVVQIVVPDVSGELWKKAVETSELTPKWMEQLRSAGGALLFVRVGSDQNVEHLDWVNSAELIKLAAALGPKDEKASREIPTQVALSELLRFLEFGLGADTNVSKPRVAVLVTAWDRLDHERAQKGPQAFLEAEYPLFAGKLASTKSLEVRAFGVSIVGGDFADENFTQQFFESKLNSSGYVVTDGSDGIDTQLDITVPVAWVIDGQG